MIYRDFLMYLKLCYPECTYQAKILYKINTNAVYYRKLIDFALKMKNKHIEIKDLKRSKKPFIIKEGEFEIFPTTTPRKDEGRRFLKESSIRGPVNELISLAVFGRMCVNTFDKIMSEFELTDLVYSYL